MLQLLVILTPLALLILVILGACRTSKRAERDDLEAARHSVEDNHDSR